MLLPDARRASGLQAAAICPGKRSLTLGSAGQHWPGPGETHSGAQ